MQNGETVRVTPQRAVSVLAVMVLVGGSSACEDGDDFGGACNKDTDCKGDRICDAGLCVDPEAGDQETGPDGPRTGSDSEPDDDDGQGAGVKPNGEICVSDLECASGICGNSVGGAKYCYGDAGLGEACEETYDCLGGVCIETTTTRLPMTVERLDDARCSRIPSAEECQSDECLLLVITFCRILTHCDWYESSRFSDCVAFNCKGAVDDRLSASSCDESTLYWLGSQSCADTEAE